MTPRRREVQVAAAADGESAVPSDAYVPWKECEE